MRSKSAGRGLKPAGTRRSKYVGRLAVGTSLVVSLALAGCGGSSSSTASSTASAAAFYKGKTITWLVPYKPGGGFDTISRLIAPYFQKYVGTKVVVENKPGGGGLIAVNDLAVAKPNGLLVGLVNTGGVVATQIGKQNGVKSAQGMHFDLTKLPWVGRLTKEVEVVLRSPKAPYITAKSLATSKAVWKWGANAPGDSEYLAGLILQKGLGRKFDIVTGFSGAAGTVAGLARGEIVLSSESEDGAYHHVQAGSVQPVLVLTTSPDSMFPKVPNLTFLKSRESSARYKLLKEYAAMSDLGRGLTTTPGVSKAKLAYLRQALKKTLADPKLQAAVKKDHDLLAYMSGASYSALVDQNVNMPNDLKSAILQGLRAGG